MKWLRLMAIVFILVFLLQYTVPIQSCIAPAGGAIALTFDDGPWPETTERLLEGLAARNVRASFFLIGEQIEGLEAIVERMATEGHQIGNHSWSHVRLDQISKEEAHRELDRTEDALKTLLGGKEYWIRPPWGFVNEELSREIEQPMIHWSMDTEDWKILDEDKIADHIAQNAQDGDIVLLHDTYASSVNAALRAIDELSAQGFEFVTLQELFLRHGARAEEGKLYIRPGKERWEILGK